MFMAGRFHAQLYIGEIALGAGFGVIIGPHCSGIFDPRSWGSTPEEHNKITLEVMRVVLATGLFAIGVALPKAYLFHHARSLLIMVIPAMVFTWLVSTGLIRTLFPTLTFVSALAISAWLTPTDPVLATAIIQGKFAVKTVPVRLRLILSAESASNDCLAYPFLSISIYLAVESSENVALCKWFPIGWLCEYCDMSFLSGLKFPCFAFSFLMKIAHHKGLLDRTVSCVCDNYDSAVSWHSLFNTHANDEIFSSVIDLILNCAWFIYIGTWMPFDKFNAPELGITPWRFSVLVLAILVLRRIPRLVALYTLIPDLRTRPLGVGAIFTSRTPASQNELLAATLHLIVSFVVLCSVIIRELHVLRPKVTRYWCHAMKNACILVG
ncbi:Sodium/hydrogen exchanger [Phellopilus nigrolimitatus]|nr:Sodium/hydrogen exchanger [Phellopilus nigrolimitatus]